MSHTPPQHCVLTVYSNGLERGDFQQPVLCDANVDPDEMACLLFSCV